MERISDKMVIVRKARKCFGCLEMINKGDEAEGFKPVLIMVKFIVLPFALRVKRKLSKWRVLTNFPKAT